MMLLVTAGIWFLTNPQVSAQDTVDYDSDGDHLIEIRTLDQFDVVRYDLNGDGKSDRETREDKYVAAFPDAAPGMGCANSDEQEPLCLGYELVNNLDFDTNGDGVIDSNDQLWHDIADGSGIFPIGQFYYDSLPVSIFPYEAIFEGNGFRIINLYQDLGSGVAGGLFGATGESAVIRNLGLEDVNISGDHWIGALVGFHQGTIVNSFTNGDVVGNHMVGGLVGSNGIISVDTSGVVLHPASITTSYSSAEVDASAPTTSSTKVSDEGAGGLAGANHGTITASYATGNVTGSDRNHVGGLVGHNNSGVITASYAAAVVTGDHDEVGGLIGQHGGDVTASYWDTEVSGQSDSAGGIGKTTAQLQSPVGYSGIYEDWDIDVDGDDISDDPWDFGSSSNYPVLKADLDGDGNATWQEFGNQRPSGPQNLAVGVDKRKGYLAVEVSWDPSSPAPLDYTLEYRESTAPTWDSVENISGTSHTLIISPIEPLTYEFRVSGRYASGLGPASEALRVDLDNPDYLLSLWEHPDGGNSITHHAPVEVSDIGASMNDQVSSFEVTRGYTVEVYRDTGFSGYRAFAPGPIFVSIDDLKGHDLNDAISSYKVYRSPALTLWQHPRDSLPDNGGWAIKEYQAKEVRGLPGDKNDQISSLYVAAGYRVELYEDAGFKGKKLTYVGPRWVSMQGLQDHDMNDQISSYKLSKLPALTLWEHDGTGLARTENAPVTSSTMSSYHNDQVSSIYAAAGYIAEVYEHVDFKGKKLVFYGPRFVTYRALLKENMSDAISSYKLRKAPALTLWEHDLEGWTVTHDAPAEARGVSGDKNDRVSSVAVGTGYIAEVYEHAGFGGKKLVFVGPRVVRYPDLLKRGMSDVISSYKLFKMD